MEDIDWTALIMGLAIGWIVTFGIMYVSIEVVEGKVLLDDIQNAPYETSDYELNKFDCTDMSAIMEKHLSDCGWDARIQTWIGDGVYGHAKVAVYVGDACFPVECTRKDWGFTDPKGMEMEGEYDDIVDAVENSRWGVGEWGLELYLEER